MDLLKAWRGARRFLKLPRDRRRIVFYAEDNASWEYLGPIVRSLLASCDLPICYLTSSATDPRLGETHDRFDAFYIGDASVRTYLFTGMVADIVVMTMPDLETFHLKRSRAHNVHYVYVFHSMVSTHMIYRQGAFDNYDTIFCVGPHHVAEIRATEEHRLLPPRQLVPHGYGRLDSILETRRSRLEHRPNDESHPLCALVAPSWGPTCLLETLGVQLTHLLLQSDFEVIVRPHPMTVRKSPSVIDELQSTFDHESKFSVETDIASQESLHRADVMISDWSGAALDYAFGLERPVLFVDTERKINNPDYSQIGIVPFEESVRTEIGEVVDPASLANVVPAVQRLCANRRSFVARIAEVRNRSVFNVGTSGRAGANALLEISRQKRTGESQS